MLRTTLRKCLGHYKCIHKFSTKASKQLTSAEMKKLNETSSKLFRILMKAVKKVEVAQIGSDSGRWKSHFLLQPPINHREYGASRMLSTHDITYWCKDLLPYQTQDMKQEDCFTEIISFFNFWVQYKNDLLSNSLVDEYVMCNMERESLSYILEKNVFVSIEDLKKACRKSFRTFPMEKEFSKADALELQRFAIESTNLMQDVLDMWNSTSIAVDEQRGLRIIATSSCIGTSTTAVGHLSGEKGDMKNRFSYRIRVENFNDRYSNEDHKENTYQLLGRKWIIEEDHNRDKSEEEDYDDKIVVNAPTTGVVGHLPVLRPGQSFEYMSGCDISTSTGQMSGCFHMAIVPPDTRSAQVGDSCDALHAPKDKHFEMPVHPFRLIAK